MEYLSDKSSVAKMDKYLEHPNNQNQPEIPNHKPLIDNTF